VNVKSAKHLVKWWLKLTGYQGITLPPFGIYVLNFNPKLIKHEQVHWLQYEKLGIVKFYVKYLWLLAKHGYKNHPMEIEARQYENKV